MHERSEAYSVVVVVVRRGGRGGRKNEHWREGTEGGPHAYSAWRSGERGDGWWWQLLALLQVHFGVGCSS